MNQKNSLGLNKCFGELENPFKLFEEWFDEAKKSELNDPNALALATSNKEGIPSVRMVLLKGFSEKGFVFYTNLKSKKSGDIKSNPQASMCFHWKSLQRQIRIVGKINSVSDKEADEYYSSRSYGSRIGAWASKQSTILNNRDQLYTAIDNYKKKLQHIDVLFSFHDSFSLSVAKYRQHLKNNNINYFSQPFISSLHLDKKSTYM